MFFESKHGRWTCRSYHWRIGHLRHHCAHRARHDAGTHDAAHTEALSPTSFATVRFKSSGDRPYGRRSEEHTSELQSLMRCSYAVFCLKKKNNAQINSDSAHEITNDINIEHQ